MYDVLNIDLEQSLWSYYYNLEISTYPSSPKVSSYPFVISFHLPDFSETEGIFMTST